MLLKHTINDIKHESEINEGLTSELEILDLLRYCFPRKEMTNKIPFKLINVSSKTL